MLYVFHLCIWQVMDMIILSVLVKCSDTCTVGFPAQYPILQYNIYFNLLEFNLSQHFKLRSGLQKTPTVTLHTTCIFTQCSFPIPKCFCCLNIIRDNSMDANSGLWYGTHVLFAFMSTDV